MGRATAMAFVDADADLDSVDAMPASDAATDRIQSQE